MRRRSVSRQLRNMSLRRRVPHRTTGGRPTPKSDAPVANVAASKGQAQLLHELVALRQGNRFWQETRPIARVSYIGRINLGPQSGNCSEGILLRSAAVGESVIAYSYKLNLTNADLSSQVVRQLSRRAITICHREQGMLQILPETSG